MLMSHSDVVEAEGKFFDGYGWLKKRHETIDGVIVTRLPIIPRGNNKIMLMLNQIMLKNTLILVLFIKLQLITF